MPSPCPVRGGPLGERREPSTRVCDLRFPFPCFLRSLSLSRGCRFSLFSAKAVHANAQLFCSLGARDRENRQPLSRERASARGARGGGQWPHRSLLQSPHSPPDNPSQ